MEPAFKLVCEPTPLLLVAGLVVDLDPLEDVGYDSRAYGFVRPPIDLPSAVELALAVQGHPTVSVPGGTEWYLASRPEDVRPDGWVLQRRETVGSNGLVYFATNKGERTFVETLRRLKILDFVCGLTSDEREKAVYYP